MLLHPPQKLGHCCAVLRAAWGHTCCPVARGSFRPCWALWSRGWEMSPRPQSGSLAPFGLCPLSSSEEASASPASPLSAKRRALSQSALRSHQPVARPVSMGLSRCVLGNSGLGWHSATCTHRPSWPRPFAPR